MDKIITVRIDTGRKGGSGQKRSEEFPPHLPTSGFSFLFFITGWNHCKLIILLLNSNTFQGKTPDLIII